MSPHNVTNIDTGTCIADFILGELMSHWSSCRALAKFENKGLAVCRFFLQLSSATAHAHMDMTLDYIIFYSTIFPLYDFLCLDGAVSEERHGDSHQ